MRRPMSVMRTDPEAGWAEFLYKTVGEGTRALAARGVGETLSVLGPIGHGLTERSVQGWQERAAPKPCFQLRHEIDEASARVVGRPRHDVGYPRLKGGYSSVMRNSAYASTRRPHRSTPST